MRDCSACGLAGNCSACGLAGQHSAFGLVGKRSPSARWKFLALLLLWGAFGVAGCATPHPGSDVGGEPLRVMVYNIHAGKDAAGEGNLERVAELVGETGADVVLLQEVDRWTRRSGGVDQLAELERLTGLHGAFGRIIEYQGGDYGLAVLSRWPVLSDTMIPLLVDPPRERAGGSSEPRGALSVRLDAPGGVLGVVNTHLDAYSAEGRRQEVETVRRVAAALRAETSRAVVGGDFNAEPGSVPIERMLDAGWTDAWAACGAGAGLTYPWDEPIKRIDYLFLAPGFDCRSAEVLATSTSDHRPLLVELVPGA